MRLRAVTLRQAFAGFIMGTGTAVLFALPKFGMKIAFGIPLWLIYYVILNLEASPSAPKEKQDE